MSTEENKVRPDDVALELASPLPAVVAGSGGSSTSLGHESASATGTASRVASRATAYLDSPPINDRKPRGSRQVFSPYRSSTPGRNSLAFIEGELGALSRSSLPIGFGAERAKLGARVRKDDLVRVYEVEVTPCARKVATAPGLVQPQLPGMAKHGNL